MDGARAISLKSEKMACREGAWASRVEIDPGRVATWTLIFTNTFFISYFLAKLFQFV